MAAPNDKMDCARAETLLVDYIYSELSETDRTAFEQHLESCSQHAKEVTQLKATLKLVRANPQEALPEGLTERIMHLARAAESQRPQSSGWQRLIWNPVAAAAVLAIVVVTVGLSVKMGGDQEVVRDSKYEAVQPTSAPSRIHARQPPVKDLGESADWQPKEQVGQKKLAGLEEKPAEFADAPPARKVSPVKTPAPGDTYTQAKRKKSRKKKAGGKSGYDLKAAIGSTGKAKSDGVALDKGSGGALATKLDSTGIAQPRPDAEAEHKDAESRRFAKPPPESWGPPSPAKESPPRRKPTATVAKTKAVTKKAARPRDEDDSSATYAKAPDQGSEQEGALESIAMADVESVDLAAEKNEASKPSDPQGNLYTSAERNLIDKRYSLAVTKYQQFISSYPHDSRVATVRYRIAKALFLAGNCQKAVNAIKKAVSQAPRHGMAAAALLDQASCHIKLNQFDQARATYKKIERDYPSYEQDARRGMQRIDKSVPTERTSPASKNH
ncbi:MAG: tetratricopeptide repeat protein [Deltaproteobacteria bacterium]|nr:tetratricopeptide repeat protein [Deltaproteobacteria bacterium]